MYLQYIMLRGLHSLIDTQLIHSIYQGDFVSTSRYSTTLIGSLPLLLRLQKRSGILSFYNLIIFIFLFIQYNNSLLNGLRGKEPSKSLRGNKSIKHRKYHVGIG